MLRNGSGRRLIVALAVVCWLGLPTEGRTCTLFGAAGETVATGGTVLVKNRDWRPDQSQELALVVPETGHRFIGLFARGGKAPGLKAGVNEAGLSVVSATAGSVPRAARMAGAGLGGRLRALLVDCDSVAQAVERDDVFSRARPVMLLLADRRELARVEIAPGGRFAVTRMDRGTLAQTNHYLEPTLAEANQAIGPSSAARAARIRELLQDGRKPFDLDGLLELSRDTAGGPDNGIWRTGGTPGATRTLATFAVATPPQGPGELVVRLADPGRPERTVRLPLDARAFDPASGVLPVEPRNAP
jgi:isopenicillin-N N-acyltransferase like protein